MQLVLCGFVLGVVMLQQQPALPGLVAGCVGATLFAVAIAFALVTAFVFHSDFSDQNQFIHFFKNVAVAGGLLQIVAFGAGRLSLDA